jgi:hypothetical protein
MRRIAAVVLVLGVVASGCHAGGGPPTPGRPVNPHAAGQAVEVGGWYPVQTLLAGSTAQVDKAGDLQPGSWLVTVVSPGACTTATVVQGKEVVCVGLEIRSNSGEAGGLRIFDDLPVLANSEGEAATVVDLRIAGRDWMLGRQSDLASSSTDCTFSAPDAQGRQQADCAAMVVFGTGGGKVATGWATVGAGKTAEYDLEYIVAAGGSGWALWWPDGTWFSLP